MTDPCCARCRGPFDICRDKTCWHHIENAAIEARKDSGRSSIRRPTEDQAIRNVMAERRKPKAATKRPFSYPMEGR